MKGTLSEVVEPIGGEGGLIGVDVEGNLAMEFNSAGMYRAWLREGEAPGAAILRS
jgi:beta-aspartyl-peptidase (threonine type)